MKCQQKEGKLEATFLDVTKRVQIIEFKIAFAQ
jgi:hypothetical protein